MKIYKGSSCDKNIKANEQKKCSIDKLTQTYSIKYILRTYLIYCKTSSICQFFGL